VLSWVLITLRARNRHATVVLVALAVCTVAATGAAIFLGHSSNRETSRRHHVEKALAVARHRSRAAAAASRAQNNLLRIRIRELQANARLEAEAAAFFRRGGTSISTLASIGGRIEWFAQSGGRIAWVRSRRSKPLAGKTDVCWDLEHPLAELPPLRVTVRDLSTGTANVMALKNATCSYSFVEPVLAFGGTHVVAEFISGIGNTEADVSVETGSVRGGKPREAENVQALLKGDNLEQQVHLLAAADDSLLTAFFDCELSEECLGPGPGAGIARITSRGLQKLFGVSATPKLLAVGSGMVAVATDTKILIASARGHVNARVTTSGEPRALATSNRIVAVLTKRVGVDWIEIYDAQTGMLRGKVDVGRAGNGLAVSAFDVVFSSGRFIRLLNARTQTTRVIAIAAAAPIGPSVDGRRVAWAENIRGGGRIRSVVLPRP
jgi:hypothetical protein